ncbi:adenylyl-sulfate kinase [Marinactinospora thermotolerans]|uniref:Adenylyl-sulfate kinase n=1 Tax=Marinactinospora thermotolerans DSM 45154 TaxID=1122192 RepID=A0A1T4SYK7_9ACTN|nr:adenylyl-sulfate kinase [Marinactinospora thermotolerans]SKA33336.1 sulfate adenylyltransferase [Marinactinospora thermotolerans DSM 45154]
MSGSAGDRPTFTPDPQAMAHLELILGGACPLAGFLTAAEAASVVKHGRLPDGTDWPVPVTLPIPDELAGVERLLLTDPEGAPLAELEVTERWWAEGGHRLAGPVRPVAPPVHGALRHLRRTAEEVRAERGDGGGDRPLLAVVTDTPLHHRALHRVRAAAREAGGGVPADVLVLVDAPLDSEGAAPMVLAAVGALPEGTRVVVVTLPGPGDGFDPGEDVVSRRALLAAHVARAYGATHVLVEHATPMATPPADGAPIPFLAPPPLRYDLARGAWRPADLVAPGDAAEEPDEAEVALMLARGEELPGWFTPAEVAAALAARRPPRVRRGLTLFFTGLSGSGKSTVARGVAEAVRAAGRTVTLLDGDVVRRMLSSGLTFSRADRDLNVRRIGYVAAEIARHGGVAICAPIAPYAATRAEVRAMAEATGDFLLVHVATPIEVCEARDRKGLYAQARAGRIPEFTGVSDPYEAPEDADLTIDTAAATIEESVAEVVTMLGEGGWLPR